MGCPDSQGGTAAATPEDKRADLPGGVAPEEEAGVVRMSEPSLAIVGSDSPVRLVDERGDELGTLEFTPDGRVHVKGKDGATILLGTVQTDADSP